MLKWGDVKCSRPEGKKIRIQMLRALLVIDARRECNVFVYRANHTDAHTKDLRVLVCVLDGDSR